MPARHPTPEEMEAIRRSILAKEGSTEIFAEIVIRGTTLEFVLKDGRRTSREVRTSEHEVSFERKLDECFTKRIRIPRRDILS